MSELFTGTGIAHSVLLFALVIASGLWLGRFKVKGVSIGSTWILFLGILASHFGFRVDPTVLAFMKDFGLILFVFAVGLQVGPGFFHSFRASGIKLNLLALGLVLLAVLTTLTIHWVTGEDFSFADWNDNEPSRVDLDGTDEWYIMLWYLERYGGWHWNDQRNDPAPVTSALRLP